MDSRRSQIMAGHGTVDKESWGSNWFTQSAILLVMVIVISCQVRAETLVNAATTADPIEPANHSLSFIDAGDNPAAITGAPLQAPPRPALADGTSRLPWSRILKEVAKQAVDQPGHFVVAATPIWASRYLIGVPWYGWAIAPLLAYREWLQWPSNRWWDPPLDWIFLTLGAVVATCRRRPAPRLPSGLPALRRRIWSLRVARPGEGTPELVPAHAKLTAGRARTRRSLNAAAEAGFRR
jgi:hypothetical protein